MQPGAQETGDAFALDQPLEQFSDGAAGRIDRRDIAPQSMRDAGDIDAAAAGVTLGRRTAHFPRRLDLLDVHENIDGRIDRQRHNVGHV